MKNLFKILTILLVFMMFGNASFAFPVNKLDKLINKSELNETSTIAISIKNVKNNNTIYELNSKKLLHPASTLKIFTTYAAIDTLGNEYLFKTQFYKDKQNNLYIKLGADPLLTSSQIKNALQNIKNNGNNTFKNLYIDDSIIDKKEFAQGWMWDDDTNPYTPKVSAYNLDKNIIKINMISNSDGYISLDTKTSYPAAVFSSITSGEKEDFLEINRYNWNNPELIEVYGTVTCAKPFTVPISSMRRYFIYNLQKALEDTKIEITSTLFASKLIPENAELLTEIVHPLKSIEEEILQNSNNLMAETIFKLAGGFKYASTGSDKLAETLFNEFYTKNGLDTSGIIVKDGCGVSRNNLLSVDWMTSALNILFKQKEFEAFKEKMAQPGDGTLSNRLHNLRGDAWLKTGSLSNISAIAGYINSQDGNTYAVAILIQNFNEKPLVIKSFENEIINIIYNQHNN